MSLRKRLEKLEELITPAPYDEGERLIIFDETAANLDPEGFAAFRAAVLSRVPERKARFIPSDPPFDLPLAGELRPHWPCGDAVAMAESIASPEGVNATFQYLEWLDSGPDTYGNGSLPISAIIGTDEKRRPPK